MIKVVYNSQYGGFGLPKERVQSVDIPEYINGLDLSYDPVD